LYLYISKSKVDNIYSSLRRGHPMKSLGLKLKAPFVEADANLAFDSDLYKKLRYLRRRLDNDASVLPFHTLGEVSVSLVSFSGSAAIAVDEGAFWLALAEEATALLLVGSAANMIGGQQLTSTDPNRGSIFSASLDPVGAMMAAFEGTVEPKSLAEGLSFGWQRLRRQSGAGGAVLRRVHGLAVFAGSYPANRAQMRRAGGGNVASVVVASPIYVEQV
jgi:hypothetical protein